MPLEHDGLGIATDPTYGRTRIYTTLVIINDVATDEMTPDAVTQFSAWVTDFVRDMSNFDSVELAGTAKTTLRYATKRPSA